MSKLVCPHCQVAVQMFISRDTTPYAFCDNCGRAWDDEGDPVDD